MGLYMLGECRMQFRQDLHGEKVGTERVTESMALSAVQKLYVLHAFMSMTFQEISKIIFLQYLSNRWTDSQDCGCYQKPQIDPIYPNETRFRVCRVLMSSMHL
jgi:hypothetical protein